MSTAHAITVTPSPDAKSVMRATLSTVKWRTSVLWQLIRFIVINLRITRMILKSHDTRLARPPR